MFCLFWNFIFIKYDIQTKYPPVKFPYDHNTPEQWYGNSEKLRRIGLVLWTQNQILNLALYPMKIIKSLQWFVFS